jgi:hypothetical protein
MTSIFCELLSENMVLFAKNNLEKLILQFSECASKEHNLDRFKLIDIWNKITPDCNINLQVALERERIKKDNELKKVQKKIEENNANRCNHKFGPKTKRSNEYCGELCKDNNELCNKHQKQKDARHTCCFVYGENSKNNAGKECGARIAKTGVKFDIDDDYKEINYNDTWLCKKHITQITKALKKKENPCTHKFGKKSKNPGETCTGEAFEDTGLCKKHQPKEKKDKKKTDAEKRKKVKKIETSDEEENDEEEKKPKKKPAKKLKKSKESDNEEEPPKKKTIKKSKVTEVEEIKDTKEKSSLIKVKGTFDPKKIKEPIWKSKMTKDGANQVFCIFVDINSGLACANEKDQTAKKFESKWNSKTKKYTNIDVKAIGVWNNESQDYDDLKEEAINYANILNIEYQEEDENKNEKSEDENKNEESEEEELTDDE